MITSEIEQWYNSGKLNKNYTHLIVVCDTFNYEDYPIYVKVNEEVKDICDYHNKQSMQKVMRVFDLSLPIDKNYRVIF